MENTGKNMKIGKRATVRKRKSLGKENVLKGGSTVEVTG
jgi:hypothetical protein